jgi:AmmeMemoRadiSam system protein B
MVMYPKNAIKRSRPPAIAGTFYPEDAGEIQRTLARWIGPRPEDGQRWRAALVPHAGWVYSGNVAAQTLSRLRLPDSVIILCPQHRPGGARWAIAPWQRWQLPGGHVDTNIELAEALASGVPQWTLDPRPHQNEHAIEVLLPMLAYVAPQTQVVGVTIGQCELEECTRMAQAAAAVLQNRDDWMFVISSDMNHFASDAENRQLDALALQQLQQADPDALYKTCMEHRISMCGMPGAVIVLKVLQQLDLLNEVQQVAYATSGDVSGDRRQVVGYAGMLFGRQTG